MADRKSNYYFKENSSLQALSSQKSLQKPSYYHYIGEEPLIYRNIGQHFDIAAEKYGSSEAIISHYENKRFTYAEVRKVVDHLAAGLLKLGLRKGDAVAIWAPNTTQWYLTMLAVARAGLVSVGINPVFQGPEVQYCLQKAKVKAIVAAESFKKSNYYEILQTICPELSFCKEGNIRTESFPFLQFVIIDSRKVLPGTITVNQVMNLASIEEISNISKIQDSICPDSPCNIQFTSGTTGRPKAAMMSHYNMINNSIHLGNRWELKGGKMLMQVPLFHSYGVVVIISAISNGAAILLPSAGFCPEASLRAIFHENCSFINGTPTMYVDLIRKQKELNLSLKPPKTAVTGGAPCSPQLYHDIKNILGIKKVKNAYGMTEATAAVFQQKPSDSEEQNINTIGFVQDHIEAKVIDRDGKIVPFGERGELCVRGYATMLGYLDDEEKTKEIMGPDKWLRTGDQFILQEDGYGRVVGRIKEMIIRGGENIFPKEIEDFLNTHPDIIETQVIGVDDERLGEDICAFVRLHDSTADFPRSKLQEFCKGQIAHFKVPRYVVVIKEFPKTISGKIQKFKLKEIFKETKFESKP